MSVFWAAGTELASLIPRDARVGTIVRKRLFRGEEVNEVEIIRPSRIMCVSITNFNQGNNNGDK